MTKKFQELLQEHNLKHIRLHDLRHSCASNMLANGVPMKEIQEWLGHANFSTTADIYSHLDFSSKIKAAKTIASAYNDNAQSNDSVTPIAKGQDAMSKLMETVEEMRALGFSNIEEYIAYKDDQTLKKLKVQQKPDMQM